MAFASSVSVHIRQLRLAETKAKLCMKVCLSYLETISQNPLIKVFFSLWIDVFFDQFSCCSDVSLSHIDECTADESYNNLGKNLDNTTLILPYLIVRGRNPMLWPFRIICDLFSISFTWYFVFHVLQRDMEFLLVF